MLHAQMWGRQIRPKVELLSSLQSEGASMDNYKGNEFPLSEREAQAEIPKGSCKLPKY